MVVDFCTPGDRDISHSGAFDLDLGTGPGELDTDIAGVADCLWSHVGVLAGPSDFTHASLSGPAAICVGHTSGHLA